MAIEMQFHNIDDQLYINNSFNDNDLDKVFIHHKNLKELGFDKKIDELNRPLFKISHNGQTIYRKFKYKSLNGLASHKISFTYQDQNTLDVKDGDFVNVSAVRKIDYLKFYYYHPNLDIRFAFKSAIIAMVISFILGFFTCYIYDGLDSTFGFFNTK